MNRRAPGTVAPDAGVASELLAEIRALRNEVADLRREIDALRQKQH